MRALIEEMPKQRTMKEINMKVQILLPNPLWDPFQHTTKSTPKVHLEGREPEKAYFNIDLY